LIDIVSAVSVGLVDRIGRLEALSEIQQLAAHHALAVDIRELADIADPFVPDVDCGGYGQGRNALKSFYDGALRGLPQLASTLRTLR